jgi:GTP-binding protein Era
MLKNPLKHRLHIQHLLVRLWEQDSGKTARLCLKEHEARNWPRFSKVEKSLHFPKYKVKVPLAFHRLHPLYCATSELETLFPSSSPPEMPHTATTPAPDAAPETRCGFIGLIGRPNVGKSTLLNRLVGQAVSIITPKPQTTRNRIRGIRTEELVQMVFIDTPGIHEGPKKLNQRMNRYALETLVGNDLNIWLVEPFPESKAALPKNEQAILEQFRGREPHTIVLLNKCDAASKVQVIRSIDLLGQAGAFLGIVPGSALKDQNLDPLLSLIRANLPGSPFFFESDQVTDATERFLVAEFVREALFRRLKQEVPYATAVRVEQFEESERLISIHCQICVERDSQKGIIIGKGGAMLKEIGTAARLRMERLLGRKVFLGLHVKVVRRWTDDAFHLRQLGYE